MKIKLNQNKKFSIEVSYDELEDLYSDLSCINEGILPLVSNGKYSSFLDDAQVILKEIQMGLR